MDSFVIDARDVRRRYGSGRSRGYEAVRGVTLQVRRGELFALLGTNGAGKTSTVELLEGLAPPDGGDIRVLGRDPYRERALVRPRTGVLLQAGGFSGELTVAETVRMWAATTTGARPVAEAIELVGLTERRDVRVKQLSGGETRRLDLAIAILGRPEVLFLDEPTTGMDPEGRKETWAIVKQLQAEETTVLLTTHYLEEAEELADRLAIMRRGQVVSSGTPTEVIAAHPSRISFDLPCTCAPEALPELPGAGPVERRGQRITIRTDMLQQSLWRLLTWAEDQNVVLTGLDARTASLEEAFLALAAETPNDLVGSDK